MKHSSIFYLVLAFSFGGCSKAPETKVVSTTQAAPALSPFDDTRQQPEAQLLGLASTLLRAGISLDSSRAERCWREESERPVVRETCALLWAGRGEESSTMESALLSSPSRLLSLALLQRRPLVGRLSLPELIARIDALKQDPHWVKAELAEAWIAARGNPGLAESESLIARIRPPEGAGPRDLAAGLKSLRRLRAGAWQEAMATYCDPSAAGESRLRCWRVLAAIEADGGRLRPLLPSSTDDDWILFTRTFPRLADKLRAFLR